MNRIPDAHTLKRLEGTSHVTLGVEQWRINENNLPFRYWLYMVCREYAIATTLELGVNLGRTTCMLADVVSELSVGVDIEPNWDGINRSIATLPEKHRHKLHIVEGDSIDPATAQKVRDVLGSRQVELLFVDSWHTVEHVEAELELYMPMLAPVSLIVMDDLNQPKELYDLFYSIPGTQVRLDVLHPLLGDPRGPSCGFGAVICH